MPSALPHGDPAPPDGLLPLSALLTSADTPFGVYLHVPFCTTRCGYCDFNTYTAAELGTGVRRETFADLLRRELRLARRVLQQAVPPVSTVFFGGGTPTLLPAEQLARVVREIDALFGLADDVEITTEANPETVSPASLARLRAAGFTRVSLGMQSAVPHVLASLDRRHAPGRPEAAVAEARAAGFEHVNLDLIYGTPGESDDDWRRSLDAAVAAEPDHVSAYALVVEDGTALAGKVAAGAIAPVDDDVLADRYVIADEVLTAAGYEWYEVSNWARSDAARCRHNELYWTNGNWWGAGPGAHSHVGGVRWWNVKHPARYAALLDGGRSPAAGRETLGPDERRTETVLLNLRRRDGLAVADVPREGRARLAALVGDGLTDRAALDAGRVVLTRRGRLLADAVVRDLLG